MRHWSYYHAILERVLSLTVLARKCIRCTRHTVNLGGVCVECLDRDDAAEGRVVLRGQANGRASVTGNLRARV